MDLASEHNATSREAISRGWTAGGTTSEGAEMTQALDTQAGTVADDAPVHLAHEALDRRDSHREARPIERFLSELRRMSPQERVRASRYTFNRWERSVYAARYPDEVPLVNGELEWIALYAE